MAFILWVVHIGVVFLLSWRLWRNQDQKLKPYFFPALLLKLTAGIGLGLLYKYHYSAGDTFGFFEDAKKLTSIFWSSSSSYFNFLWSGDGSDAISSSLINPQSRSLFLVKIISCFNILTGNNYWITNLYFSFISFWSAFLFFKKIAFFFPGREFAAAIAFLFFPSIVFWSSGVIKESLAMAGLFMLSTVYITLLNNSKPFWWEWVLAFLSLILVWNLKYYWIAVFIPVTVTTCSVHLITKHLTWKMNMKLALWIAFFLVFCLGVTLVHPNFYLENFLIVLVENYDAFIRISPAQSVVRYPLEPTWWSVVLNSPKALLTGFFRPFLWEATNFLQLIVAVENLFVFIFFITALSGMRAAIQSPHRLLIFSTVVYILLLCLFLALSTPNLGSLARYKVGFQPFFVFLLLANNARFDKLKLMFDKFFRLGQELK